MLLLVRRSILIKYFVATTLFSLFICIASPSYAQHPMRVAPPPMPFPPAVHPPAYRAPAYQPPNYPSPTYPPIYGTRISTPANAFTTVIFRPPARPIHPLPPALRFYFFPVAVPVYPSNFCWWATCGPFWTSALVYNGLPLDNWNPTNSIPAPVTAPPIYVFGAERPDLPQLFLKDGTTLFVNDYWVVDNQLHFTIIEDEGMQPAEHVVPFDDLDLQTTIDMNTKRGFRFMLRNEPVELYMRDHPEGPPSPPTPH